MLAETDDREAQHQGCSTKNREKERGLSGNFQAAHAGKNRPAHTAVPSAALLTLVVRKLVESPALAEQVWNGGFGWKVD
jgi:hypothetical protein